MSYRDNGYGFPPDKGDSQHPQRPSYPRILTNPDDHPAPTPGRPPRSAGPVPPQQRSNIISFQEPEEYRTPLNTNPAVSPPEYRRRPTYENKPPVSYADVHASSSKPGADLEDGYHPFAETDFRRKKSLVRPDRGKIEPGHPQYHYHSHAALMDGSSSGTYIGIEPSRTGNVPHSGLKRGKSLLGREEDLQDLGLNVFKKSANTLRRKRPNTTGATPSNQAGPGADLPTSNGGVFQSIAPGPVDGWMVYCWLLTCCVPPFLLRQCGISTPEQQRAWREKMGLMAIILCFMAGVGFLTFGFNAAVCGKPPNRYHAGTIDKASIIIHGYDYDFSHFKHPQVSGVFTGNSNPLYEGSYNVAGMDLSFMFQYTDQSCYGILTAPNGSAITSHSGLPDWLFPCNPFNQFGTSTVNFTGYENSTNCHIRAGTQALVAAHKPSGQVYYTWDDVNDDSRNLAVYESTVLDLNLLNWLDTSQIQYPPLFNDFKKANDTFNKRDITMWIYRSNLQNIAKCLQSTITVGFIDTKTIGCVASQVVLWVSLVFIIGVVAIRFIMAVYFGWFVSWRIGAFKKESYRQRMARAQEIENWTDNIYRPAPSRYRPSVVLNPTSANAKSPGGYGGPKSAAQFLPTTSRFSRADAPAYVSSDRRGPNKGSLSPYDVPVRGASSLSLSDSDKNQALCPFPLHNVVPQPPPNFAPFGFRPLYAICLVTAYSESLEGIRTTLDSLATSDYPNSHKLLMVIADGMVKGHGNTRTTPDIILGMMKDLVVPTQEVEAHSYVSIADGHKRHNMAKVYAGFYDYDDNTVEPSKQQRVPIVLVAKTGNGLEVNDPKPGNRGKRDSQMVLMAFLQKVMFDERMTTMEYEFFNSIWRCTGVSPDRYEVVLCVDADTKIFPDSLTRMASCMAHDEEIMGLCGETKIANKSETWVTMIQVFEYYISHHLTKAFESMFGGVTCLPGCFSMYRIKAPKGSSNYWVPILANPDIVVHYSENIVDTLHKKNLLLLGEDRYLSTLMLKTFPKRKMIFCPQAVCKTIVPDTFSVLLSQRRRWINSTVHNLAELLFVRDLCGTFCFSMQFVVGMELVGTLVLPAAIAFTIYLIIISIVPSGTNTTIPLILLAIILGLPGLLIVITSRKIAYVGWMLVYLLSLPIWNFVLPAYAYWHFDDFSWGQTRKVSGDHRGNEGDKEGEFDSSHIIMKRWVEFERERRWKSGMNSADSSFDVVQQNNSAPKRWNVFIASPCSISNDIVLGVSRRDILWAHPLTPILTR
ncbi:uncharacterized protein EI90DRAFT_2910760 [Cantharellus anzutake]|uniref:uncharacterized protein n=1 Tax=Cantharellus anzutake TaxID=1750568 RepID=UPI0019054D9F|nr:uncharacterized protein EI90DRAFT_2910760 [Cantharellus anzutake]KAF8336851.1 hypothetical protein EI90DRAFT_2910760 [Cantharellus anzutake]